MSEPPSLELVIPPEEDQEPAEHPMAAQLRKIHQQTVAADRELNGEK